MKTGQCEISATRWRNMAHLLKDYLKLLTVARQLRTTMTALANCGCVEDCLPCLKKVNDVAEAFDTLVEREEVKDGYATG